MFRVDPIKLIPMDIQKKLEKSYRNHTLDYKKEIRDLFYH